MPIRSTTTRVRRRPPWARPPAGVVIAEAADAVDTGCCLLESGCCLAELAGCVLVIAFLVLGTGTAIGACTLLIHRL